jgi:prophage regulatory protein
MAKILDTAEVQRRLGGVGRTTLWRMERAGNFPPRRVIVGNCVGWIESEVEEWIHRRPLAPGAVTSSDAG